MVWLRFGLPARPPHGRAGAPLALPSGTVFARVRTVSGAPGAAFGVESGALLPARRLSSDSACDITWVTRGADPAAFSARCLSRQVRTLGDDVSMLYSLFWRH